MNQNQTYREEVGGGFLWSPKRNKGGGSNQFYENMTVVRTGDVVFSFCDTLIKAIGIATEEAKATDRPDFGKVGDQWTNDGWLVRIDFMELQNFVRPKDFIAELIPHFPEKYSPIRADGGGNQVYLAEIPEEFANILAEKIGVEALPFFAMPQPDDEGKDDAVQAAIEGRTDIGSTQKQQLIQARRGQGLFKANVARNEKCCRVTGVTHPNLLVASHIKPWSESTDEERLDGCNGLLLAPHIDRLFDRGFISFGDDGSILLSPSLDTTVLDRWSIRRDVNVGAFDPKQQAYLAHHRAVVLRQ